MRLYEYKGLPIQLYSKKLDITIKKGDVMTKEMVEVDDWKSVEVDDMIDGDYYGM